MAGISSSEEYHQAFDAEEYLSTYYGKEIHEVHHETALKGLHELYSGGARGLKILEIGCGPVIAFQISAALFASEIVMAELVKSNRDAVQLWLDKSPNAHDWTPFFRYVVQTLEGKGEEEVARREEQLRKAVKVIYCNVLEDPPVPPGYEGPYDVVLETAVLDAVCSTDSDLTAVLVRLSKLLKPGGRFVSKTYLTEGTSTTTHTYVGGECITYKALNISEEMLQCALTQAGFSNISVTRSPPYIERVEELGATYCGVAFVSAVKAYIDGDSLI